MENNILIKKEKKIPAYPVNSYSWTVSKSNTHWYILMHVLACSKICNVLMYQYNKIPRTWQVLFQPFWYSMFLRFHVRLVQVIDKVLDYWWLSIMLWSKEDTLLAILTWFVCQKILKTERKIRRKFKRGIPFPTGCFKLHIWCLMIRNSLSKVIVEASYTARSPRATSRLPLPNLRLKKSTPC